MQTVVLSIEINGIQKSISNVDQLKAAIKDVQAEISKSDFGSREHVAAQRTLATLQKVQQDFTKQTRDLVKEKVAEDQTYRGLSARLNVMRDQYKDLVVQGKANTKETLDMASAIRKLDKELKDVDEHTGQYTRSVGHYEKGLSSFGRFIGGNLLAGGIEQLGRSVVDFGQKALEAFDKSQKAQTSLFVALKGDEETMARLVDRAKELQATTLFDDDQIVQQQAFLASMGLTEEQINKVIGAATDLATGTGQSLESAVKNLGKTFNGTSGELGELVPQLKTFTAEELKSGAAIDVVSKAFEGQAAAAAKVGTGPLAQIKNLVGDLTERFGGLISEGLQKVTPLLFGLINGAEKGFNFLLGAVQPLIGSFKGLFGEIGKGSEVGEFFGSVMNAIGGVIKFAVLQVKFGIDGLTQFIRTIRSVADNVPILGKAFDVVRGIITTVLDGIGQIPAFVVGASAALKQLFQNINNLDFSTSIGDAFNTAFDSFKESSKPVEAGISVGKDITIGVTEGIKSGTKGMEEAAKKAAKEAKEAAKKEIQDAKEKLQLFEFENPTLLKEDANLTSELIAAERQRITAIMEERKKVLALQLKSEELSETAHALAVKQVEADAAKELMNITKAVTDDTIKNLQLELEMAKLLNEKWIDEEKKLTKAFVDEAKKRSEALEKQEVAAFEASFGKREGREQEFANEMFKIHQKYIGERKALDQEYAEHEEDLRIKKAEAEVELTKKLLDEMQERTDKALDILQSEVEGAVSTINDGATRKKELEVKYLNEKFERDKAAHEKAGLSTKEIEERHKRELEEIEEKYSQRRIALEELTQAALNTFRTVAEFETRKNALDEQEAVEVAAAQARGESIQKVEEKFVAMRMVLAQEESNAKLALLGDYAGAIGSLFGEQTVAAKLAAVIQATINAYLSASNVFKLLSGVLPPPFPTIAAGLTLVSGLARADKIRSIKAEEGVEVSPSGRATTFTKGMIKGPRHSGGGVKGTIYGVPIEAEGGEYFGRDNKGTAHVISRADVRAIQNTPPEIAASIRSLGHNYQRNIYPYKNDPAYLKRGQLFMAEAGVAIPRPDGVIAPVDREIFSKELIAAMSAAVERGSANGSMVGSAKGIAETNKEAMERQEFKERHSV